MTDRINALQTMLKDDPNDTFALYGLAMEHAKAGDHETAVTYFDRTIEADPAYAYAYFHKARSLEALNQMQQALETVKTGLDQARKAGDAKAAGELEELLETMQ